ncbi:MAG: YicC family protein [Deltaproteobacteria bacterium]|nr:YicC family protein [Deltaproteobacteria bacterium]
MIKSMTGYGRAKSVLDGKNFVVETKSVNHRNMEIIVRLPGILNALEIEIKKKINEIIFRGRVEVNIRTETDLSSELEEKLYVNLPLIRTYYSLLNQIRDELDLKEEITLDMLSRLNNAFYYPETELNLEETWKHLEKILGEAIDSLVEMREKEGELLYRDFISRADTIKNFLSTLKSRAPHVILEYKKRLEERVAELTDSLDIDESRMSQEIAIMTEKSDITEEIVRFESHLIQFREMLESVGAVGRKMDFLLQEMHREINTIGSKSNDFEISLNVIEIKSELAKMREQAQNVE